MHGTVDGFGYGAITPIAAYIMACFGSALGLRCTMRALLVTRSWRLGWLTLGAGCIGSGIWTMHFIAMMGFTVREASIRYDTALTFASLAVAIGVVGIGVFIVGIRGANPKSLIAAGLITGLGVAVMHYMGMAAMQVHRGALQYDTFTVTLSVVIAVLAATAALWAASQVRGILWSLGASLIMGVAVTGMHYTGMAAVGVRLHSTTGHQYGGSGSSSIDLLVPMLIGPLAFLLIAGAIVMFDPLMMTGDAPSKQPVERLAVQIPYLPAQPARPSRAEPPLDREERAVSGSGW